MSLQNNLFLSVPAFNFIIICSRSFCGVDLIAWSYSEVKVLSPVFVCFLVGCCCFIHWQSISRDSYRRIKYVLLCNCCWKRYMTRSQGFTAIHKSLDLGEACWCISSNLWPSNHTGTLWWNEIKLFWPTCIQWSFSSLPDLECYSSLQWVEMLKTQPNWDL
jgi:hypothetical protein